MPSFGEFLIDRQLTTAAQLVDALVWQQQERTPIVQLILDSELLPPGDVLKVLDHAAARATSFEQALGDLALLSDGQIRELREEHVESGPHIGQVLVAMGAIKEDALEEGLRAFRIHAGGGAAEDG